MLARIAVLPAEAKDVAMGGLRLAAWGVATANAVFLALGLADMDGTLGWLPCIA